MVLLENIYLKMCYSKCKTTIKILIFYDAVYFKDVSQDFIIIKYFLYQPHKESIDCAIS